MGFQVRGTLVQIEVLFDRPEDEVGADAEEDQVDMCGN